MAKKEQEESRSLCKGEDRLRRFLDVEHVGSLSKQFSRKYGAGAVSVMGDASSRAEVREGLSSQSLLIDMAIGRPGFPVGRLSEISGLESVGKSLLGLHLLAETQRLGGIGIFCDTEESLDFRFVKKIGVIFDSSILTLCPPDLESAFEMFEAAINSIRKVHKDCPVTLLFDSVAGCPTKAELKGDYDDAQPATHARVLSRGLRKFIPLVAQKRVVAVFINQLRQKIGGYGNNEFSFGGMALKYLLSLRIQVKKTSFILDKDKRPRGIEVEVKVIKNKMAAPGGRAVVSLLFDRGLYKPKDLLDAAVVLEEISEKAGYYYFRGEDKRFSGKAFPVILKERLGGWEAYRECLMQKAISLGKLFPYGEVTEREGMPVVLDEIEDAADAESESDDSGDGGEE